MKLTWWRRFSFLLFALIGISGMSYHLFGEYRIKQQRQAIRTADAALAAQGFFIYDSYEDPFWFHVEMDSTVGKLYTIYLDVKIRIQLLTGLYLVKEASLGIYNVDRLSDDELEQLRQQNGLIEVHSNVIIYQQLLAALDQKNLYYYSQRDYWKQFEAGQDHKILEAKMLLPKARHVMLHSDKSSLKNSIDLEQTELAILNLKIHPETEWLNFSRLDISGDQRIIIQDREEGRVRPLELYLGNNDFYDNISIEHPWMVIHLDHRFLKHTRPDQTGLMIEVRSGKWEHRQGQLHDLKAYR